MNAAFWAGKRVLITGHTGFKGGWLGLWLERLGAEVAGYALPPSTNPSLFELARIGTGMKSTFGDVRDLTRLKQAVAAHRPEIVFHLAAQPLVRASYSEPVETYATNVMGTVHLLEAARSVSELRAVVVVTSDKCYENREWIWGYREDEPLGGHDPYSSSKGCAELVTSAYRRSFFAKTDTAIATARAGNVIGGGDWAPDRLIPDLVRAFLVNETVMIRNPEAIRPWQHVLDALHGYLLLAEHLWRDGNSFAESWNFGPLDTDNKPVKWLAARFSKKWGPGTTWARDGAEGPHEARYLKLDCSKARARLNWQPQLSLGQSLDHTCNWYLAYAQGCEMRATTLGQIDEYAGSINADPV